MQNRVLLFVASVILSLTGCQKAKQGLPDYQSLNQNWSVYSSEEIQSTGDIISMPEYDSQKWYQGNIPATVFAILRQNNLHNNIFMGDSMDLVDKAPFQKPWWYRKVFQVESPTKGDNYTLELEGINYKANIWINGQLVADDKQIEGVFGMWKLDVTKYLTAGNNALAIEVIPAKKGDLTIGFVDWNPTAPDNNMGLWRGVYLKKTGAVSLESPFVRTQLNEDNSQANLTASVFVANLTGEAQEVTVQMETPGLFSVQKDVLLTAGERKEVVFGKDEYPSLHVQNPQLWWPHHMGEPTLHNLTATVKQKNRLSDKVDSRYGIREITQYLNANGDKGFKINGFPTLIKGGGWVDDVFLADEDEKVKAQVAYVKHMNMNTIRLEGFWGKNKTLYDACDENGILLMIGWSCQWEWEAYCGRPELPFMMITGDEEMVQHTRSYVEQVSWLRNHPSVFLWVFGSDKLPLPKLEKMLNTEIEKVDPSRPLLASCKYQEVLSDYYQVSEVSGPTGVKMKGPYNYVPPVYWYIDTIAGGAYGFNTETGPGPQVSPIESILKMIPTDKLWPMNEMWNYHCGRHEFGSLDGFLKAFDARYGKANDLETFAFKVQMSNYEAIRPMFEAFQVNHGQNQKATGVIQWMLNSAWPEFYWQLYDYYLMPNGAFYGAKKGCQPLNIVYNYGDKAIYVVNEQREDRNELTAKIKVYDINSKELMSQDINISAKAGQSIKIADIPTNLNLSAAYFVALKLTNNQGVELADNFYWLSTKSDEMDFPKTTWVTTPQKSFANMTDINRMPQVEIGSSMEQTETATDKIFKVKLENPNPSIAFFIELQLVNEETGQTFLPVLWSDNYVSLLPNESREYTASISKSIIGNSKITLNVKGWNTNK